MFCSEELLATEVEFVEKAKLAISNLREAVNATRLSITPLDDALIHSIARSRTVHDGDAAESHYPAKFAGRLSLSLSLKLTTFIKHC